ncbi:MAG: peroxiredoxin [Polyangiaceae bacterium]|nr:peroxiredoxin [Myxococcales bacterium]MCB9587811.1 peroxiredoxin [Polyangiaceae bacterium]MCB9608760.1 peroxiredoxin [Polyangiaceae bacterium]
MAQLEAGQQAPEFTLTTQAGERWTLSQQAAKGPVVLFFYPKNDTPVCIVEACSFRDQHEVFARLGAQVVGVSSDNVQSHGRFAGKHELPYTLLADEGGEVRSLFGVKKTLGFFDGRVTFVIDQGRLIRHVFSSALNAKGHVEAALQTVQELAK